MDELAPHGDDPGGIATDLRHVREPDVRGLPVELVAEQVDLLLAHDHEDRFLGAGGVADERPGTGDEVGEPVVEEGVVLEAGPVHDVT